MMFTDQTFGFNAPVWCHVLQCDAVSPAQSKHIVKTYRQPDSFQDSFLGNAKLDSSAIWHLNMLGYAEVYDL